VAKLSGYLVDTANLLRDSNFLFNSKPTLTTYINRARDQVAKQSGCLRALIAGQSPFGNASNPGTLIPGGGQPGSPLVQSFSTLVGVEKYSFGYANPFLQANNQGYRAIVDVIDLAVSWGGQRPSLNWMPWEDLQAYARSYNVGVFSYPFLWSTNGSGTKGQVWLFPVPQIIQAINAQPGAQGEMEWDATCLPTYLYSDDDYEALPDSVTDAVPFWAAYLAFLGSQRYSMAAVMKSEFNDKLNIDNAAGDRGKSDSYYWGTDY
jgi:hypothetical protein